MMLLRRSYVNPTTRGFLDASLEFLDISKTVLRTEYEGFFLKELGRNSPKIVGTAFVRVIFDRGITCP